MKRAFLVLACLPLAFFASGCVLALRGASQPTVVKLRVESLQPRQYVVRVALTRQPVEYEVASDGRVEFTVPSISGGCDELLLGIKIGDGSPERVRIVELRRAARVVRKLSLAQLAELPKDQSGFSVVRVGD